MTSDTTPASAEHSDGGSGQRPLTDAARRALAEAEERRRQRDAAAPGAADRPAELGGRGGPDPVRYGDWENGGIASDF